MNFEVKKYSSFYLLIKHIIFQKDRKKREIEEKLNMSIDNYIKEPIKMISLYKK